MGKMILPLILLSAFIFISLNACNKIDEGQRQMHGPEREGIFFEYPEMKKKKLGLSDEQVDKISKINLEYKKKLLSVREKFQPKQTKLQSLLKEDNINLKDVRSLLDDISALEVEIRMLWINQRMDIEKVLTVSQKNKLRDSRSAMPGQGGGNYKDYPPPPPPFDSPD